MKEIEYRTGEDKSLWGEGPWITEPDKIQWIDDTTKLHCLALRGPVGNWNGYVGVPKNFPLANKDYDADALLDIRVHGGLTYSGETQTTGKIEENISFEGAENESLWWFGFDTAHVGDAVAKYSNLRKINERDTYKDLQFIRREVSSLAQQLFAIEGILDQHERARNYDL